MNNMKNVTPVAFRFIACTALALQLATFSSTASAGAEKCTPCNGTGYVPKSAGAAQVEYLPNGTPDFKLSLPPIHTLPPVR